MLRRLFKLWRQWAYPVPICCHVFRKLPNNFNWKCTAPKEPAPPTSFTIEWKILSVWTEILFCGRAQLQLTTLVRFWAFRFIGYFFQFHRKTSFSSFPTKIRPNGFLFTIGRICSYLRNVLIWGSTLLFFDNCYLFLKPVLKDICNCNKICPFPVSL